MKREQEKLPLNEEKKKSSEISRRDFLMGAGTVVASGIIGSGLLSGCKPETETVNITSTKTVSTTIEVTKPEEYWLPEKWDKETDVVIVGFGGAGSVAAITAFDEGSDVIIIEKAPIEGGGASRMSGAGINWVENDKVDTAAEYMYIAANGATPLEVLKSFAVEMSKIPSWLEDKGIDHSIPPGYRTQNFPNIPGGTDTFRSCTIPGNGYYFYEKTKELLNNRGVEILFNTPGKELIQNPKTKEILGIIAENNGTKIAIKAKKGVVLTCGGFEYNEAMQADYLRQFPVKSVGWIYNTGDGIKMAQKVGADLWHMDAYTSTQTTILTPNTPIGWLGGCAKGGSHIWVNRLGKRFVSENPFPTDIHRSELVFGQWDTNEDKPHTKFLTTPFYLIFDEKTRLAGAICNPPVIRSAFTVPPELGGLTTEQKWSSDNSYEIEQGWIKKANTIRELGALTDPDMDIDQLEATVARWNQFCEAGEDLDFGRNNENSGGQGGIWPVLDPNLSPIDTPPYYCLELWPSMYHTCGGPRKNAMAQIVDVDYKPIPRLYEAGSLGSTVSHVYSMGGHNWAEVVAFGHLAGRNVSALQPWE